MHTDDRENGKGCSLFINEAQLQVQKETIFLMSVILLEHD